MKRLQTWHVPVMTGPSRPGVAVQLQATLLGNQGRIPQQNGFGASEAEGPLTVGGHGINLGAAFAIGLQTSLQEGDRGASSSRDAELYFCGRAYQADAKAAAKRAVGSTNTTRTMGFAAMNQQATPQAAACTPQFGTLTDSSS